MDGAGQSRENVYQNSIVDGTYVQENSATDFADFQYDYHYDYSHDGQTLDRQRLKHFNVLGEHGLHAPIIILPKSPESSKIAPPNNENHEK